MSRGPVPGSRRRADSSGHARDLLGRTVPIALGGVEALLLVPALPALPGCTSPGSSGWGVGRWLVLLGVAVLLAAANSVLAVRVLSSYQRAVTGTLQTVVAVLRGDLGGDRSQLDPLRAALLPGRRFPLARRTSRALTDLVQALEIERAFRSIVDASGDPVIVLDDAGRVTFLSQAARRVLGVELAAVQGHQLAEFIHAADLERFLNLVEDLPLPGSPDGCASGNESAPRNEPAVRDDSGPGNDVWPEDEPGPGNEPGPGDEPGPRDEPTFRNGSVDGQEAVPGGTQPPAQEELGSDDEGRPQLRLRTAAGDWRVLEWAVSWPDDPALGAVALTGRDVTERVQMERVLVHQATHDPLTGLPNRQALLRTAADVVRRATAEHPVSVLMIDLDRFKDVNDSLGHAVGDRLLAQVGPRLRAILRPGDTIARLGGDEFAVLLPGVGEPGALLVGNRLAAQLDTPFEVDGMDLHVEASIGIAVSHSQGREASNVEALLREADIAMYRAKEGGTVVASFDPQRDGGQSRSRLELSADLRRAISEEQLVLHYQPVVDVLEGRLAGVEALVRWQHPERGLLSPAEFLPLAEQTGLIIPLSKLVLAAAVRQAAGWAQSGRPVQIAVNMSPRWLQHTDVPDTVARLLAEFALEPRLLRLEITESVVLANPEETLPRLIRLRDMGVGLSLDDFGTGYSSMTHLRGLPIDEVKVDRAFVQAMTSSPEDAVIVRAAVELGHNLGKVVVAEGIEDAETLAEVIASGCSLAQGYYFAPPLPAGELIAWALRRFPGRWEPAVPALHRTH